MTDSPVLFVTGLGRCGTTMVMQMLAAAGVPCTGSHPAFEDIPVKPSAVDHDWLKQQAGRAVKWIDPTVTHVKTNNGAAVLLTRSPIEQARSHLKLLGKPDTRLTRRALAREIERDAKHSSRILYRQFGIHFILRLRFENVLADPAREALKLAVFCDTLGLPFGDPADAAAVVLNRSAKCAPDLSIELGMMREVTQ